MTQNKFANEPLGRTVLVILDGWGNGPSNNSNAAHLAKTPVIDRLFSDCPSSTLVTHGKDVGLPIGQMGNSEVGHMNIGAGRIVEMDLPRINRVFDEGKCGELSGIRNFVEKLKLTKGKAHLFGLLSDGGVHAHQKHMTAVTSVLAENGVEVLLHLVTDGRDVAPKSAANYLCELNKSLPPEATIATICGRYFAMDRNNNWDRTLQSLNAMLGGGASFADPFKMIDHFYSNNVTDEFFPPARIGMFSGIGEGDGFLCLNFRADRARQILTALGDSSFDKLNAADRPKLGTLSGLVKYSDRHDTYMSTIFPEPEIPNTLGEWVSKSGGRQLRIAETEKYPHVTYFLNGGKEAPFIGEDRILVPSPSVATYDLKPEMSAREIAEEAKKAIESEEYDLIVVNFANPDMVGHSGDLGATRKACETVDNCLGQLLSAKNADQFSFLVTADHGNCETMRDPETGQPHTAHTINTVPVCVINAPGHLRLRAGGRLADVAPTILQLMNLETPAEMTGRTLLAEKTTSSTMIYEKRP